MCILFGEGSCFKSFMVMFLYVSVQENLEREKHFTSQYIITVRETAVPSKNTKVPFYCEIWGISLYLLFCDHVMYCLYYRT